MNQGDGSFGKTRWSVVARAAGPTSPEARQALEELCRAYWWPLYAYLRRHGQSADDATDTVQGLFADLIQKGRLAQADPNRGRFRCWLLSALKYHLSHQREHRNAVKRGGRTKVIALDEAEADRRWTGISRRDQDPDRLFDRAWAIAVLEVALVELQEHYSREGKADLFTALKPNLVGDPASDDLRTLAGRLGMSVGGLKTATLRLRRAFGDAIRNEVQSTLDNGCDVEEEVGVMFSALARD